MRLHPTLYAGRLKRYWPLILPNLADLPRVHTVVPDRGLLADQDVVAHTVPRWSTKRGFRPFRALKTLLKPFSEDEFSTVSFTEALAKSRA